MGLLSYLTSPNLSDSERHTINWLMRRVRFRYCGYDDNAANKPAPYLSLYEMKIASPLLMKLEMLIFGTTDEIEDLRPFRFLKNLKNLNFGFNRTIKNIEPLASLKNLSKLDLSSNPVEVLSPIESLPNLACLILSHSDVTDVHVLTSLPKLNRLSIGSLQVRSFQECARLASLERLDACCLGDSLADFSRFPDMPQLRSLVVRDVCSLAGIQRFPELQDLSIRDGKLDDLTPLNMLSQLTHLDIENDKRLSIAPIISNRELRQVTLNVSGLSDISPLFDLPRLREFKIHECQIDTSITDRLQSILGVHDNEFRADSKQGVPSLDLAIIDSNRFGYLVSESYGMENWDGDRALHALECNWIESSIRETLKKYFKEEKDFGVRDQGFDMSHGGPANRRIQVWLESRQAIKRSREIIDQIQHVLCWTCNEWIVELGSGIKFLDAGYDFRVFVFRDHLEAAEYDRKEVSELLLRK